MLTRMAVHSTGDGHQNYRIKHSLATALFSRIWERTSGIFMDHSLCKIGYQVADSIRSCPLKNAGFELFQLSCHPNRIIIFR